MVQKINSSPSFPALSNPDSVVQWATTLIAQLTVNFGYFGNRLNSLLAGDGTEQATAPVLLASYTVATLPDATKFEGGIIYVKDGTANKRLGVSDGTNWRFPDGAIVS